MLAAINLDYQTEIMTERNPRCTDRWGSGDGSSRPHMRWATQGRPDTSFGIGRIRAQGSRSLALLCRHPPIRCSWQISHHRSRVVAPSPPLPPKRGREHDRGRPTSVTSSQACSRAQSPGQRGEIERAEGTIVREPAQVGLEEGAVNRGIPYLSMAMRSIPMPQAKPWYSSGSRPQLRSTLGCTIPQPRISIQSSPLAEAPPHPSRACIGCRPRAMGSVKGKNDGRKRILT